MRERTYLNFDLMIEPTGPGAYRARVLAAPAGETPPVPVTMPFSDLEVENFLLRIGRPRQQLSRGGDSPEAVAVREFGGRLFDAVFHDELRVALATSVEQAEGQDAGLRVRLRLAESPELADLPWEYLYDRGAHRFLALSEWTPLVRYLDLPGRIRPLPVHPPLRILVLVASPTDFPALDVEAEWARLRAALRGLERAGRVQVDRVPTGTLADLHDQLRRGDYHVFHYIGHGRYDAHAEDGVLALEGPQGRGQQVSGADLGDLLHDYRTLRLVLLNSCEGARGGRSDPYSGTAQSLVRQGVPAVVAMQFDITDQAAITFAQSLYEAVADGYPLDAAMADARKAVRHQPNPVEWGTPVLYLRSPDGRIFDVPADEPVSADRTPVVPLRTVEELAEMARGTDLDVAAGAAVALRPLVHDDDHQVSQVAQAALDAISPRPETSRVDLGPVLCGQPAHARVWVEGSPLALASAVQTSGPGVEARLDAGWLHVQVVPRRTGPVDAAVTLVGAAGDARVDIVGEATAPAPTEEPKAAAVVPLVLLGAAAVAAAWWLKEGDPWRAATLPLVVPAIACLAAAVCLARHRLHAVAVGTVAGVAAWSVIFWARNTVYDMTSDKIAILPGDPAAFAAHWARLVAAVVLGIAVVSTIKATPRLRARVSLQPGSWSAVGVLLTVAGVLQPIIALAYQGPGDPEMVATQWMLILVVCLPVAWLGFNADQRRAALAGVVALTMFIVLRSVWEMIADQGLQPHLTVGAAAAIVMAGSVVGQARLRPAPHGRAPHPPGIAASG